MRSLFALAAAATMALVPVAAPAQANPHTVDPRPSNEVLGASLKALARQSHGRITVRSVGQTNEGRPIWAARVGYGPIRIQYVTQQHGDEPLGTPAAVEFLKTVGLSNSAWQRWLRSRVTVDVIVRANPDGHVHDWRYNYDPAADPEFGEKGKGYDINRYHNPSMLPADNPVPEAAAIQRAYAAFRPAIVMDYHMQGRYTDADGREITASMLWPTNTGVTPEAVAAAKQVTVVAARAVTIARGNVSQYPGGDYEGIARNAYGLLGSASVLLELSAIDDEQSQIRAAYAAMLAVVQSAADGSLRRVDPARADAIPPRGEPVTS
jgi:zinc carboxypeptidase